jgi:hypothetical protein
MAHCAVVRCALPPYEVGGSAVVVGFGRARALGAGGAVMTLGAGDPRHRGRSGGLAGQLGLDGYPLRSRGLGRGGRPSVCQRGWQVWDIAQQ